MGITDAASLTHMSLDFSQCGSMGTEKTREEKDLCAGDLRTVLGVFADRLSNCVALKGLLIFAF